MVGRGEGGIRGAVTFCLEKLLECPNAWVLKSGCKRTQNAWKTKKKIAKIVLLKACSMTTINSFNLGLLTMIGTRPTVGWVWRWTVWTCYRGNPKFDPNTLTKSFEIDLAATDLQRTLQALYKFRSDVNKVVNNMDVLEKHLQRKIQEGNWNTPLLIRSKWPFSEPPQKRSWSFFAWTRALVLWKIGKGNNILIVDFHDTYFD